MADPNRVDDVPAHRVASVGPENRGGRIAEHPGIVMNLLTDAPAFEEL